ncbi:DNA polymerase-1 [Kineococcus xinjiangensis]|uniref:DNA-directed DNA polymerase n=1 Tax=Kineococcus xinjiangensis TaxID=512762 RepID=A0A2S6IUZ5_9ACTN|nr:DNA polymerase [Kineococcus xinjiangensis]PPK98097.1 DNA polymerase-1 [Kineococcus xinjiangensis]
MPALPDAPDAVAVDATVLPGALAAAGLRAGDPLALCAVPGTGLGLAGAGRSWAVAAARPEAVVAGIDAALGPRWVWWSAAATAGPLVAGGVRPGRCWDVGAVHRLLHGDPHDDAASAWAAALHLPPPAPFAAGRPVRPGLTALDLDLGGDGLDRPEDPLREDGGLRARWVDGSALAPEPGGDPAPLLRRAARWAGLALHVAALQERAVADLPDRRVQRRGPALPLQTAWSESAAALLAVELEHDGLPVDRAAAEALVAAEAGPRPRGAAEEAALRAGRDRAVTDLLPAGAGVPDLRNPAQVLAALRGLGLDLPDTRAWRLERFRDAHPAVAALLTWRKAERIATTYGYAWLDRHVGVDGRLRGAWGAADAAAGRMTAQAGLHNMPAELRPGVAAEPGHVLVRADLGQVEPRVLAAVSQDPALAAATLDDDLYTPVAAALGCDRPTAKIAVLAAMYGQTSGTAGQALRRMDAAYPRALAFLRSAEAAGQEGRDLRTAGGRLLRLADAAAAGGEAHGRGRFARNAVVQGAAAELFKAWAATVRAGLGAADAREGGTGRIVLCLHDELLVHVPAERAGSTVELLHAALAATAARWAAGSGVRFVADVAVVRRWSEAK